MLLLVVKPNYDIQFYLKFNLINLQLVITLSSIPPTLFDYIHVLWIIHQLRGQSIDDYSWGLQNIVDKIFYQFTLQWILLNTLFFDSRWIQWVFFEHYNASHNYVATFLSWVGIWRYCWNWNLVRKWKKEQLKLSQMTEGKNSRGSWNWKMKQSQTGDQCSFF